MNTLDFLELLNTYGPFLIFFIMFLEGLNLTGIPALVILPTIGVFIANSSYGFTYLVILTIIGALLGNLTYYFISYKFGRSIFDYFYRKFPVTQKSLDGASKLSQQYGSIACLIGRILPGARTFVSLVSGIFKVKFKDFILYSLIGITLWNVTLISIGYFIALFGEIING